MCCWVFVFNLFVCVCLFFLVLMILFVVLRFWFSCCALLFFLRHYCYWFWFVRPFYQCCRLMLFLVFEFCSLLFLHVVLWFCVWTYYVLLFLVFVFCLNSWLCFWWVVLPSCCLHACIALVICSCVLRFSLFLSSRARQHLETYVLRAILEIWPQKIRRNINQFDKLHSVSVGAQPGLQTPFPTEAIGRARPHFIHPI